MMEISEIQLKGILENSWAKETSSDPKNRNTENRSRFQCTATALNIQELFGGKLLRQDIILHDPKDQSTIKRKIVPHFFNEIGGKLIDMTEEQLQKTGKTTRKQFITIIDEQRKNALLDVVLSAQEQKEILGKIIREKLIQIFDISLDDLENYLKSEKIRLTA